MREVICGRCGEKLRVGDNDAKWVCPKCGTVNTGDGVPVACDDGGSNIENARPVVRRRHRTGILSFVSVICALLSGYSLWLGHVYDALFMAVAALLLYILSYCISGSTVLNRISGIMSKVLVVISVVILVFTVYLPGHAGSIARKGMQVISHGTGSQTVSDNGIFADPSSESASEQTASSSGVSISDNSIWRAVNGVLHHLPGAGD